MPMHQDEETAAVEQFLEAFNFTDRVDTETVRSSLFQKRQFSDINGSRDYVEQFLKKCERRDPTGVKPLRKRVEAVMNESPEMTLIMDFLVRCRQAHLFHKSGDLNGSSASSTTPSIQSSPFQRRSASRGRVLSTMTGDHHPNDSSRSRANSSFTSYDTRMMGMERQQQQMSARPKSPFRINGTPNSTGIPTTRVSPLTASNHLFSDDVFDDGEDASNNFTTLTPRGMSRDESPYRQITPHLRPTPSSQQNHHLLNSAVTSSIRSNSTMKSATPLHSRLGSAITETESTVCECLLSALLGIETRLFTPIHRKMAITSTASLSTTHLSVCHRVLSISNIYLSLSHKESPNITNNYGSVTLALMAAIRRILGEYIADIDGLRRKKKLNLTDCLPIIDKWHYRMTLLEKAHKIRNSNQLDLLESLYVLHSAYSFDEDRKEVLDKILDYTLGVFCQQMMDWMTTGEVPAEKWIIEKDVETEKIVLKKVPVFITDTDAKILLEIGKSLPRVGTASDEDLEAIDKATSTVRAALCPKLIFDKQLTPILQILRDVVCGIVMRMVLTTGRLREHIQKATSFFFLTDPRFTVTLYNIIKEASMGLRVGSASLSRQTVSSALAAALEATTSNQNSSEVEKLKKQKLKFTLDALTSVGATPNISSKMQFVQPLRPHYEPHMDLMKPIFSICDDDYESIFHIIWAIDLARLSIQEVSGALPEISRLLVRQYSLRENATCLVNILSHLFQALSGALLRLRVIISCQIENALARFWAAIDEKCQDVDDVIREHQKFVHRVSIVVFAKSNEKIEHEIANLLRVAFEAQEMAEEFINTWHEVVDATVEDENIRKAKIAEMCQKRTLNVRILMETVNKSQKKLMDLLEEQITYGNDALIE